MKKQEGMMICRYCNKPKSSLAPCDCKERTLWRIGNMPINSTNKKRLRRLERQLNKKVLKNE